MLKTLSKAGGWTVIAALALGSLVSVGVAGWYYLREREAIEGAVSRQLAATVEARSEQIANWRGDRFGDGRVQAASSTMQVARRILSGSPQASDRPGLIAVMRQLEKEFGYTGAFLVDRNGNIRLQYPAAGAPPERLAEFARTGAVAADVALEDLYFDTPSRRPLMALNIPVQDLGALILEIDPSRFLYPYLRKGTAPGSSVEDVLVRLVSDTEFVYLSDLRQRPGSVFVWKRRIPKGIVPSALGTVLQTKSMDYRGKEVLVALRSVPNSPWFLFEKIDVAEVDAPVRRLGWEMALLIALIGITNLAVVALVWRGRELRIYHEREGWFRSVANDTPAYLWMSSAQNESSFINKRFADFLGATGDKLSGEWLHYWHPDDRERVSATFLASRNAQSQYLAEGRIRRFDGEYRWIISRGLPRFSERGEFLGYAGSVNDITERREAEQKLLATNGALEQELAERKRHEEEIQDLTARLMNAQEDERRRLARELHDDLSQQLAALSIAMSNLKRNIPKEAAATRDHSDQIQQKLVQTAESVRQISHRLHPAILEHSGLARTLAAYCREFSSLSGICVAFQADGCFDGVPPFVALNLFRITQEALQNVAKHARVAEASVNIECSKERLRLTIVDRGAGMEPSSAAGLGLVSIKERSRLIHATVSISSNPNQGTVILVES